MKIQQLDKEILLVDRDIFSSIISCEPYKKMSDYKLTEHAIAVHLHLKPYKHYYRKLLTRDDLKSGYTDYYDLKPEEINDEKPCFYYRLSINSDTNLFEYNSRDKNYKYNYASPVQV